VQIVAGDALRPIATARTSMGSPRTDVSFSWKSDNPSVASVDPAGLVIALKPGKANITATCESAHTTMEIDVAANPVKALTVEPKSSNARTADVFTFSTNAPHRACQPT